MNVGDGLWGRGEERVFWWEGGGGRVIADFSFSRGKKKARSGR